MPIVSVLSPAKTLNLAGIAPKSAETAMKSFSAAEFGDKANILVSKLQAYSTAQLRSLLGVSASLAQLNYDRFQEFGGNDYHSAVYTYDGPAYKGLGARTNFTLGDWYGPGGGIKQPFPTERLAILSGLYGVLRPMDGIKPYRLEMGMKVDGESLYDFWGSDISKSLNARFVSLTSRVDKGSATPKVLLNLASQEYFKAIDLDALDRDITVISVRFLDGGKVKSVYAKKARGLMVQYIIKNKIDSIDEVKKFDLEGYEFDIKASTDGAELVFQRSAAAASAVKKKPSTGESSKKKRKASK